MTEIKRKGRPPSLEPVEFRGSFDETLQFIESVLETKELYSKTQSRMVPITPAQVVQVVSDGIKHMRKQRQAELEFKEAFVLKRFSNAFRTLDVDQPSPEDVIIAEHDGKRHQVIVKGGYCHQWSLGKVGEQVCALSKVSRWRPCVFTDKPVQQNSLKNDVLEALERGRAVKNGEKL